MLLGFEGGGGLLVGVGGLLDGGEGLPALLCLHCFCSEGVGGLLESVGGLLVGASSCFALLCFALLACCIACSDVSTFLFFFFCLQH